MSGKRQFHSLEPDETFIFHFRHDLPRVAGIGDSKIRRKTFKQRAVTVAIIVVGVNAYVGVSPCSWQDQFNRKLGYRIALGRAKSFAHGRYSNDWAVHKYPYTQSGTAVTMKTKVAWAKDLATDVDVNISHESELASVEG